MPEIRQRTIEAAHRTRTYTVLAPAEVRAGAPLILAFHGSKQTGDALRRASGHSLDALTDRGAVLAFLDGYHGHWNDARLSSDFPARRDGIDDVAFTEAVVAEVRSEWTIGPVYVFGYSNGRQMAIRLVHQAAHLVEGAVIVSATQPAPGNFDLSVNDSLPTGDAGAWHQGPAGSL